MRLSRSGRRPALLALGGLVGALVVAVPLAWASHQFTDVPDSSPFHQDISAVRTAGITSGKTCDPPGTPPTYCPLEPITREAMAAFVHRGFGRTDVSDTVQVPISDSFTVLGEVVFVAPDGGIGGVPGNTQFVKIDAAVTTYISNGAGCPCATAFFIRNEATMGAVSPVHYLTNDDDSIGPSGFGNSSGAVTAVVPVPTGTTAQFRLLAFRSDPAPPSGAVTGYASMSAVTVPFGGSGGNTISTLTPTGRASPPKSTNVKP